MSDQDEARRIALAKAIKPILRQAENDLATLHPRGTLLSHAPLFLADRLDEAGIGVAAPHPLDGLRAELEAISALTLGGERSEAIVTSVGDIARVALRDEGETT